jgi:hypothetical protein
MIDGSEIVEREEGIPAQKECPVIESCGPSIFRGIRNLFIQEINSETVSQVSVEAATVPIEAPLLVQRCNGTTAGLGYLEVNVICPCKTLHWTVV